MTMVQCLANKSFTIHHQQLLLLGVIGYALVDEEAIAKTTTFKIVADYGNSELEERETPASILTYGTGTPLTGAKKLAMTEMILSLFKAKPEEFDLEGTLDRVFNEVGDRIQHNQVQGIQLLEISFG